MLEIFEQNIIIGCPKNINGADEIINNPRFSTAIGLVKYGLDSFENEDDIERVGIISIFKNLFIQLRRLYKKWY